MNNARQQPATLLTVTKTHAAKSAHSRPKAFVTDLWEANSADADGLNDLSIQSVGESAIVTRVMRANSVMAPVTLRPPSSHVWARGKFLDHSREQRPSLRVGVSII